MRLLNTKWCIGYLTALTIGLLVIYNSISLADYNVWELMQQHGGSMDTNEYLLYLNKNIEKYMVIGSVLSTLGGIGIIVDLAVDKIKRKRQE